MHIDVDEGKAGYPEKNHSVTITCLINMNNPMIGGVGAIGFHNITLTSLQQCKDMITNQ